MAAQTTAEALAADFAAAIARGEPCYAAGAAAGRFELSAFLQIATEDDGGMCSASLPAEGGIYAGDAGRRDVSLPLAAIVAAAAAREGASEARSVAGFEDASRGDDRGERELHVAPRRAAGVDASLRRLGRAAHASVVGLRDFQERRQLEAASGRAGGVAGLAASYCCGEVGGERFGGGLCGHCPLCAAAIHSYAACSDAAHSARGGA